MAQIFRPSTNTLATVSLLAAVILPVAAIMLGSGITRSSYNTKVGVTADQPVPFSHEHHVTELGIDCRYCHSNVEKSSYAGVPPTQTCMSCHSQIWTNSPLLEPIRQSYQTNTPMRWVQLNKVPEFVYFNHSIHIRKGVSCNICHGPVQKMQLAYRQQPFFMAWCLQCHRNPEKYVRPREEIFNLYQKYQKREPLSNEERSLLEGGTYDRTPAELEKGRQLVKDYHINVKQLSDCWVCHR